MRANGESGGDDLGARAQIMREAANALPIGILSWRADGRLRFANKRAVEILGGDIVLGMTAVEAMARWHMRGPARDETGAFELLPPEVFAGVAVPFRDVVVVRSDGERRVIDGRSAPAGAAWPGASQIAITTFDDVTDRHLAEALRAAEARVLEMVAGELPLSQTLDTLTRCFEALVDHVLASVLLVEDGVRLRHAAAPSLPEAWRAIVDGVPVGPDQGSCGTAAWLKAPVISPDIATDPCWKGYRDAALSFGFRACWSIPIIDPAGQVLGTFAFYHPRPHVPTAHELALTTHASRIATLAIQRERDRQALTERQRLSDELALLRARDRQQVHRRLDEVSGYLQMATRSAQIGIWCWNVDADTLEWDDVMCELHGATRASFTACYEAWRSRVHPDDMARAEAALAAAMRGEADYDIEFRVRWPDGTERHIKANAVVQRDEHGRAWRVVGTNWDITAAKAAEEALRGAKDAAEAATRAKSLFLANMSHEIRTPMNALLGYAQMLERDGSLAEDQRAKITVIRSSGDRLLALLNDVLDMSEIEAGRATLVLEAFDLHALLGEVERTFSPLASGKGLVLALTIDSSLPRIVVGDAQKIRQVLINLVSNATKFTERGWIWLRAGASSGDAEGDASEPRRIAISVEDSGTGISDTDLGRVFHAFDRASVNMRGGGTGLGLAISRSFAAMMGGALDVQSRVAFGSTFTFTFAAVVAAEHTPAPSAEVPTPTGENAPTAGPTQTLQELLAMLPPELTQQLRDAALQARPQRVEQLAEAIRDYSEAAALRIHALVEDFRYDALLEALG